jgi:hypothetical protein
MVREVEEEEEEEEAEAEVEIEAAAEAVAEVEIVGDPEEVGERDQETPLQELLKPDLFGSFHHWEQPTWPYFIPKSDFSHFWQKVN